MNLSFKFKLMQQCSYKKLIMNFLYRFIHKARRSKAFSLLERRLHIFYSFECMEQFPILYFSQWICTVWNISKSFDLEIFFKLYSIYSFNLYEVHCNNSFQFYRKVHIYMKQKKGEKIDLSGKSGCILANLRILVKFLDMSIM